MTLDHSVKRVHGHPSDWVGGTEVNHPYNDIELKDAPTYLAYWIKMNELGEHKMEDWVEPC